MTEPKIAAEDLARRFHETYERLAPDFGYETRRASAKPWAEVPEQNRALMVAVCAELLPTLSAPSEPVPDGPRVLGYVVATKGADGFWHDDWDGKVHGDLAGGQAALAECRDFGCESTLGVLHEAVEEATP